MSLWGPVGGVVGLGWGWRLCMWMLVCSGEASAEKRWGKVKAEGAKFSAANRPLEASTSLWKILGGSRDPEAALAHDDPSGAVFCLEDLGSSGASQVVLVVKKNLLASAGDMRYSGSIPGFGKILLRRAWQPNLVFLSGESHRQRSLVGLQRVGHAWSDLTCKAQGN